MQHLDPQIIDFIKEHQKGKSGIYPNQVIDLIRLEFKLPRQIAYEYVSTHIKEELSKFIHS